MKHLNIKTKEGGNWLHKMFKMSSCLVVEMIVLVTCVQTPWPRHFAIKLISNKIRSSGSSTDSAVPHHVIISAHISQICVQCWSCCLGTLLRSVSGKCGQTKWSGLQFLKSICHYFIAKIFLWFYKTCKISFKIEDWIIHLIFRISVGIGDYAFANCF